MCSHCINDRYSMVGLLTSSYKKSVACLGSVPSLSSLNKFASYVDHMETASEIGAKGGGSIKLSKDRVVKQLEKLISSKHHLYHFDTCF